MLRSTAHHVFKTAAGFAVIGWNAEGICSFRLPDGTEAGAERALFRRFPKSVAGEPAGEIGEVVGLVKGYFDGERIDFSRIKVDLGEQEPFFVQIYAHVRKLGWGETTTYGAVAKALGEGSEAARTVGEAMARNPVPLIIPCHRVTAAGGKIGGFSAPGGSTSKAHMLELEGVKTAQPSPDQIGFNF